jgi:predicted RNase H-like nuclease (RuvC/YqgF family)
LSRCIFCHAELPANWATASCYQCQEIEELKFSVEALEKLEETLDRVGMETEDLKSRVEAIEERLAEIEDLKDRVQAIENRLGAE